MIVRGPRPADNFAQIHNAALADGRLSYKARGILAYLLSRPPGWQTSAERLASSGIDGERAVKSGLKELEALGYLQRRKRHGSDGTWIHEQIITDQPEILTPSTGTKQPDGKSGPDLDTTGAFCTGGKSTGGEPPSINNTEPLTLISDPVAGDASTSPEGEEPQTPHPSRLDSENPVMDGGGPARKAIGGWYPSDAALKTAEKVTELEDIPLSIARYVIRKAEMKQEPSSSEWLRWLIADEKEAKERQRRHQQELGQKRKWFQVAD